MEFLLRLREWSEKKFFIQLTSFISINIFYKKAWISTTLFKLHELTRAVKSFSTKKRWLVVGKAPKIIKNE